MALKVSRFFQNVGREGSQQQSDMMTVASNLVQSREKQADLSADGSMTAWLFWKLISMGAFGLKNKQAFDC